MHPVNSGGAAAPPLESATGINCYHQNSCFDLKVQFTNHLSAGLRPDLPGELTELGWLDPLAGCGAHRKGAEKETKTGGGNVDGKGDKA